MAKTRGAGLRSVPEARGGRGPALRFGARGPRVVWLQRRLAELGHDPGPQDGVYGYFTFAAVKELQRALGLPADGLAHRRVLDALSDPLLNRAGRPELVAEVHESLGPAAASRAVGRLLDVLQGVGVAVRARGPHADVNEADESEKQPPTGKVPLVPPAGPDGLCPWHCLHTRARVAGDYDSDLLRQLLHRRAGRKLLVGHATQAAAGLVPGPGEEARLPVLYLDLGSVSWGDGGLVLRTLRRLHRQLQRLGTALAVSVPLPVGPASRWRLLRALDPGAVADTADFLVLVPPAAVGRRPEPRPPSPGDIDGAVRDVVADVPSWRCYLLIPLGATMFDVGLPPGAPGPEDDSREEQKEESSSVAAPPVPPTPLSYQQAMALAYSGRTRPQWDESARRPVFRTVHRGRLVVVWMENRHSLPYKFALPARRKLAGAYLHGLGLEDPRLWSALRHPPARRLSPRRR